MAVVSVIAYRVRAGRGRRIRSLSVEDKARYAHDWSGIQARFVATPITALQEADKLALSILRDWGARINDGWRPAEMHRARELGRANAGLPGAEDLRNAMSQYQIIVDDAVGESMRKSLDAPRQGLCPA